MIIRTLFPRLLVAFVSLFVTASVIAQNSEPDRRQTGTTISSNGSNQLETDPSIPATIEERRPRITVPVITAKPIPTAPALNLTNRFDQMLLSAIESHLGATYHFNRTGPESFDCSGLVWRSFQDVGVNFQRGPARSYWATFAAPEKDEQFKFGTLVFFSGLTHVGIVVDEKGFYHASRRNGVIYSPFNDYWLKRIDGFRRVPLGALETLATEKVKPVVSSPASEEGTPR